MIEFLVMILVCFAGSFLGTRAAMRSRSAQNRPCSTTIPKPPASAPSGDPPRADNAPIRSYEDWKKHGGGGVWMQL